MGALQKTVAWCGTHYCGRDSKTYLWERENAGYLMNLFERDPWVRPQGNLAFKQTLIA